MMMEKINVDYTKINNIINTWREKSKKFLITALS